MRQKTVILLSILLFLLVLLWGGFTLLVYLGVPAHTGVMVPASALESIQAICSDGSLVCRGFYSLVPFIQHTLTRVPFVGWYAAASVVLYLIILGWHYLHTVRWEFSMRLSPWKLLLIFIGCMWLIFNSISHLQVGDSSIRRIIEPLPQVYVKAGAEALEALQENFDNMQNRRCLERIGEFNNGAGVFWYKTRCVQEAFITRIMPPLLVVLVLFFEMLVTGRFLMFLLRLRPHRLLVESVISVGLGVCAWVALLWFAAVLGMFVPAVGWGLVLGIPLALYKQSLYWLRAFFRTFWNVHYSWRSPTVVLGWILISYLALNFINVVRPFPIGWDDLGSYLNRPRLLVSYGEFIFSMASFQWEYLTAMGFLLFGYSTTFGATSSMIINWSAGLMTVLVVFALVNTFLGRGRGILAASLYYMLPLVGHFSFADMKIDNAVFFMGSLVFFALFLYLFYRDKDPSCTAYTSRLWVFLAGLFAGYAFGFKVTSVMVVMAAASVLAGVVLHSVAFLAAILFVCAVFAYKGVLDVGTIMERVVGNADAAMAQNIFIIFCIVFGLALLVFIIMWRGRARVIPTVLTSLIFLGGFFATVLIWTQYNNVLDGEFNMTLSLGAPNRISPTLLMYADSNPPEDDRVVRALPAALRLERNGEFCTPTGSQEELGRYWGNRKGWGHYLTLPFRTVMNLDSAGYYVTTIPTLLLFPLLLLLPFFWTAAGRWVRWLWLGTFFLLWQWVFLANGIPWYGIGTFLGLAICLEVLCAKAPDVPNRILIGTLLSLSILICLNMRFWQFEQQVNLFEYPIGKVSAEALEERTIPYYNDITRLLLERKQRYPDRPYVFRVGTFIPYFVPKNLEIIGISDHQLDFFNCLYQERNPAATVARLKALGFNSIIFDTNTATIERDPQGSLHQKVDAFASFLNSPEAGLQVVINDPAAGVAFLLIP